jgi:hypothetical protein
MNSRRHPATLTEITPAPLTGLTFPRRLKIPKIDILPRNLLNNSGMDGPNELLKTKGREKKDVKNEGSSQ